MSKKAIMLKPAITCAALVAVAALTGCTSTDGNLADTTDTSPPSEQAATASQSLGILMDASTESVLDSTSSGDSTKAATPAGAEIAPDLQQIAKSISKTVDLATLKVNNQLVFPTGTASGTITITANGTAADSWPAGTTTLYTGSVTVALTNVVISGSNGDSLTIPSGGFSYDLDASGSKTDSFNWTITTDTTATVSPALSGTAVHNGRSHSVTLSGLRKTHAVITRVYSTASPVTNTRNVDYTVSGNTAGTALSGNPALQSKQYTSWVVTVDGVRVEFNRNAHLATTWDYTQVGTGTAYTVNDISDTTFISTTTLGITAVLGPYTAAQVASALSARIDAKWL